MLIAPICANRRKQKSVLWDKKQLAFSESATVIPLGLAGYTDVEDSDCRWLKTIATQTTRTTSTAILSLRQEVLSWRSDDLVLTTANALPRAYF